MLECELDGRRKRIVRALQGLKYHAENYDVTAAPLKALGVHVMSWAADASSETTPRRRSPSTAPARAYSRRWPQPRLQRGHRREISCGAARATASPVRRCAMRLLIGAGRLTSGSSFAAFFSTGDVASSTRRSKIDAGAKAAARPSRRRVIEVAVARRDAFAG